MAHQTLRAKVPSHTLSSLDRYISHHTHPGGFLAAVLTNDLKNAFAYADEENRDHLFDIVNYLYNVVPGFLWGSDERFEAWLDQDPSRVPCYEHCDHPMQFALTPAGEWRPVDCPLCAGGRTPLTRP